MGMDFLAVQEAVEVHFVGARARGVRCSRSASASSSGTSCSTACRRRSRSSRVLMSESMRGAPRARSRIERSELPWYRPVGDECEVFEHAFTRRSCRCCSRDRPGAASRDSSSTWRRTSVARWSPSRATTRPRPSTCIGPLPDRGGRDRLAGRARDPRRARGRDPLPRRVRRSAQRRRRRAASADRPPPQSLPRSPRRDAARRPTEFMLVVSYNPGYQRRAEGAEAVDAAALRGALPSTIPRPTSRRDRRGRDRHRGEPGTQAASRSPRSCARSRRSAWPSDRRRGCS